MEVALRRRLEGVASISISQEQQTAEVTFEPPVGRFSPAAFREAVLEAEVAVVRFEVELCGEVVAEGSGAFLNAGDDRYALSRPHAASERLVCVTARLNDVHQPATLDVIDVRP